MITQVYNTPIPFYYYIKTFRTEHTNSTAAEVLKRYLEIVFQDHYMETADMNV